MVTFPAKNLSVSQVRNFVNKLSYKYVSCRHKNECNTQVVRQVQNIGSLPFPFSWVRRRVSSLDRLLLRRWAILRGDRAMARPSPSLSHTCTIGSHRTHQRLTSVTTFDHSCLLTRHGGTGGAAKARSGTGPRQARTCVTSLIT